jgi:hypothetical protein
MSEQQTERHCHADGAGPCLATDCPIAGMGPLVVRGGRYLRPCPGALGPQHPATAETP